MERGEKIYENGLVASAVMAMAALLFYSKNLAVPGSLYTRVTRDFWPLLHTWPHYELCRSAFEAGRFPLWNHLNALGAPLLGNLQAAPFHPARIVLFLLPFWKVIDAFLLIRVFVSGMGTYWFLRWRGSGWQGAVLGGLAWMFSGSVTDYLNMHYLDIDLLAPFGLLAFGWMARSASAVPVLTSTLVVLLAILGGNPTSALYLLIFVSSYYFFSVYRLRWDVYGGWVRFCAVGVLSALAGAIALTPFIEFLSFSWNYHPPGLWSNPMDWRWALSIFGPEAYTSLDGPAYPLLQRAPYVGTVVISLAFPSLFYLRRMGSGASFFAAFVIFFGGVIWGIMPFVFFNYLPLFVTTSNFRYAMPEVALSLALLAGMSWDRLRHGPTGVSALLTLPMLLTAVGTIAVLAKLSGLASPPVKGEGVLLLFGLAWCTGLILILKNRRTLGVLVTFILLVTVWLLEATLHYRYLPSKTPEDPVFWQNAPVAETIGPGARVYGIDRAFHPNLNMVHGIEDVRYFGALYTGRYRDFMSAMNGKELNSFMIDDFIPYNYIRILPDKIEGPLTDLAGIDTILSPYELPANRLMARLVKFGNITTPTADHIMLKTMDVADDGRNTLYTHPPTLIEASMPAGTLGFGIGIDQFKWTKSEDGVNFTITEIDGKGRLRVLFSRHLDPNHSRYDRRWFDYSIDNVEGDVNFITTPYASVEGDWSGWSKLRSTGYDGTTRFDRLSHPGLYVYDNQTAAPRVFLVGEVIVRGRGECINEIETGMDFRAKVCLEGMDAHGVRVSVDDPAESRVEWKGSVFGRSDAEVEIESGRAAVLVLSEMYYPGWRAYLGDGSETKIYPADGIYRAIMVPKGANNVRFVYEPVSFKIGLWATVVTLFTMAGIYSRSRLADEES